MLCLRSGTARSGAEGGRLVIELHALPRVFFAQKSSLTAKLDDHTGIIAATKEEEDDGLFYNGVDLKQAGHVRGGDEAAVARGGLSWPAEGVPLHRQAQR